MHLPDFLWQKYLFFLSFLGNKINGVWIPSVAQRVNPACPVALQVQSPAWQSGLRIQHCCSCGVGFNPWEFPYALGSAQKEKKNEVTYWAYVGLLLCQVASISVYPALTLHRVSGAWGKGEQ